MVTLILKSLFIIITRLICRGEMFIFLLLACLAGVYGDPLSACVNCTLYNREYNGGCPRSSWDCGKCLEGYEEAKLTPTTGRMKPCVLKKKADSKKDAKLIKGQCNGDKDCSGNTFCFYKFCKECYNCLSINRVSTKTLCAKDPKECGPCLVGYYETHTTSEASFKPCRLWQVSHAAYTGEKYGSTSVATVSSVAVVSITFLATVIFGAFVFIIVKRNVAVSRNDEELPMTPISDLPAYSETNATLPKEETTLVGLPPSYSEACIVSHSEEFTSFVSERKEVVNEAICFRNPTAPYYPPSAFPGEENIENEEPDNQAEIEPDDDEATVPSSWTPNASSSSTEETTTEICSFSGLFPSSSSTTETEADHSNQNVQIGLDQQSSQANTTTNTQDLPETQDLRETQC